jgi:hypothetical protein
MDQKIIINQKIKTNMKTQEQIKQEIVNYLTKTSAHTFIKPKATFKWGDSKTPGYYEYDYNDFTYFKVIKVSEDFYSLENSTLSKLEYRLTKIDVDLYIKYWDNNSKCVLSNSLFQEKKMKSVKSNKYHLSEIDKIVESIKR